MGQAACSGNGALPCPGGCGAGACIDGVCHSPLLLAQRSSPPQLSQPPVAPALGASWQQLQVAVEELESKEAKVEIELVARKRRQEKERAEALERERQEKE